MQIIAIANQKGGVAKTTTAHNLGAALRVLDRSVLLIDLDSQASLTISLGLEPLELDCTMADVFRKDGIPLNSCIIQAPSGLDIAPSVIDLASVELELISRASREKLLARSLAPLHSSYDFVVIDCPPQLSVLTVNALSCANGVLIPVKTDYLAYRGLTLLEDSVNEVRELVNSDLRILGVIATLYDARVADDRDILALLQKKCNVVGVIKRRASAKKGVYDGLSVVEREPNSEISQEYMAIAKKLVNGEIFGNK